MKFTVQPPSSIQLASISVGAGNVLEMVPATIRKQQTVTVAYVEARGDSGSDSKAILYFNSRTGEFTVQRVSSTPLVATFDKLKPDEFAKQREAATANANRKTDKSKRPTDIVTPLATGAPDA